MERGYDATKQFLKSNKKIADELMKEIKKRFGEIQVAVSGGSSDE